MKSQPARYAYTYPITANRIRTVSPALLAAAVAEHAVRRLEKLAAEVDGDTISLGTLEIEFRPDERDTEVSEPGGMLAEARAYGRGN